MRRRSTFRALNGHKKEKPRPLLRFVLVMVVAFTMLTSGASAATLFFYGESLPSLTDFKNHMQFQDVIIKDSGGRVLYDMADLSQKDRGRRVVEPLVAPGHSWQYYRTHSQYWLTGPRGQGIPVALQNATVATEDATFYDNPGFDPLSIIRAGYDDLRTGHVVSGASTITQQLIRKYLLSPDPTMTRKVEEIVLAWELTQKYPKSKILWYYLNSIPYGNLAIGAEAAAETYFNKHVWQLDAAQCAFLAGLPEAPSTYDPVNNLPAALNRMRYVLHLMYVHGYLVDASGQPDPSLITQYMTEATKQWPRFKPPVGSGMRFPHFVQFAVSQLQELEKQDPSLNKYAGDGLDVVTTINLTLQQQAQAVVSSQIASLAGQNVTDGALVSLDIRPGCYGCVLAMVGSADYNAPGGQINMADTPRQPGSSFKPFNYIRAFQNGAGPATLVDDAPLAIPDQGNPADGGWYQPTDYDGSYHGVVSLRVALDNSLNVPAVKVEQFNVQQEGTSVRQTVGAEAVKLGVTSLFADNPSCCGWSLTLGGLERGVRLVEETAAYGAFATGGNYVQPWSILRIRDRATGSILWDLTKVANMHDQVIDPAYAYVMNNVLSDDSSRCTPQVCEFGTHSFLYLGRPAGAKTGTTNSYTDNWTVGYTPQIVTGVWVGNANNSPMINSTGITGAAPIWNQFMQQAIATLNLPPVPFNQPPRVYSGSTCRQPGQYGYSLSSISYDIYAGGVPPICSIGTYTASAPVPQQQTPYQQPPAVNPTAVPVAPTAVPAPVAPAPTVAQPPPAPAPTVAAPPPVQAAPTAQAPPVTQSTP